MTPEEIAAQEAETASADSGKTEIEPSQAVKTELDRQRKPKTEAEKLEFSLRSTARRAEELGLDPKKILGVTETTVEETEDDVPAWYKRERSKMTQQSALERAESIQDEDERELMKETLRTRVNPNLDAEEAWRVASGYVNSIKATEIAKEVARKPKQIRHASSAGAPAKSDDGIFEPTPDEQTMMRVAGLTEADIKSVRTQALS